MREKMIMTLHGSIISRPAHAAEEEYADFTGSLRQLFDALTAADVTGCECCAPSFVMHSGLTATLADSRRALYWSLSAEAGEALGLRVYQSRGLGETHAWPQED